MKKWYCGGSLLGWLAWLGSFQGVVAQTPKHTVSGYVREAGSGELLIGVNVYVPKLQTGTATNAYGFYSLTLPADSVELVFSYTTGLNGARRYYFDARWQDLAGGANFYRISANSLEIITRDTPQGPDTDTLVSGFNYSTNRELLRSDRDRDGQLLSVPRVYKDFFSGTSNSNSQLQAVIALLTTDENYYRYHLSLADYAGDDPFVEPTIIYSNVEGGLGVFGAYQETYRYVIY